MRGESLAELGERIRQEKLKKRAADPLYQLWMSWGLQLSQTNAPVANLFNAATVLREDPKFKNLLWFDEFQQRILTLNGNAKPREWAEKDDIYTAMYIQSEIGIPRIGRDLINQAVIAMAHQNTKNCVRDWIESLQHDGTNRIEHFFSDFMGADESEYVFAASRNFWLTLVARAYHPGCKVDNMIVLEGSQGVGKSTALGIIGGEHYAEQHESAANPKGFAEILQGKLLIEISEMDSFTRAEVNRVKQTVSCASDRFRASYGRYALDHPRTCIFVGTTNRDDWNRDETGARRFWPIACKGSIDLDGIRANRDHLFAEAARRYIAGEPYWQMPEAATRTEQENRYQDDPWLSKVQRAIQGKSEVTTESIMEELGLDIARRDRAAQMRVGACLRFLKWKRGRSTAVLPGQIRPYVYVPPQGET